MQLNQAVLYEGTVSEELKMLVSLVASQTAGCRYCQAHMANLSKIYEASLEKIAAVWEFETSDLFSDAERAALRVAYTGAMAPSQTAREHFDELYRHFDEAQVVEIVASISLFGFLNRWNDTMATELESVPAEVARKHTRSWIRLGSRQARNASGLRCPPRRASFSWMLFLLPAERGIELGDIEADTQGT